MTPRYTPHFTLPKVHRQPVAVAFDAPVIVSDTGLLTLRDLDRRLGYLADLADRLPDPRAQPFVLHSAEEILAQQIYQILADYSDCNDADSLRSDPLFQVLAGAVCHILVCQDLQIDGVHLWSVRVTSRVRFMQAVQGVWVIVGVTNPVEVLLVVLNVSG